MDAFFAVVVGVLVFVLFAELGVIACLVALMRKPVRHHLHGKSGRHTPSHA